METMGLRSLFGNAYEGKRVLVTGHTGFKGAWLTLWLKQLGADVIGYSLAPESNSLFTELGLENEITHYVGDIRDFDKIQSVFRDHKPEYVFHMAAQPLVRDSYSRSRYTFETNVIGTVNVLECMKATDGKNVLVNITTDKCYENKEWHYAYRENDPLGGYDPYSASKACSELVTNSYRESFFNPNEYERHLTAISTVRAGNVVGGGDWAEDRIIPDCIRALSNGKRINVRNPEAIRPWQHVLEPLSGYLWLGNQMTVNGSKFSSSWNFGPKSTNNLKVADIVNKVIDNWGSGSWEHILLDSDKDRHEAMFLKLDCTKANNLLQWTPVYNISETISKTVDWYFVRQNQGNVLEYTINQIYEYVNEAANQKILWATAEKE